MSSMRFPTQDGSGITARTPIQTEVDSSISHFSASDPSAHSKQSARDRNTEADAVAVSQHHVADGTEPQADAATNPYLSLPFSDLEKLLSRLTEEYGNMIQQGSVATFKAYSEHEKNENDFIQVLQATLLREIATRDGLNEEIHSCKEVIRNFLNSIEI